MLVKVGGIMTEEDLEGIQILLHEKFEYLTIWEENFLKNVEERGEMSKKEKEIFDSIWVEIMIKGRRDQGGCY